MNPTDQPTTREAEIDRRIALEEEQREAAEARRRTLDEELSRQAAESRFNARPPVRWARLNAVAGVSAAGILALLRAENGVGIIPPWDEHDPRFDKVVTDAQEYAAIARLRGQHEADRPPMRAARVGDTGRYNLAFEGALVQVTVDELRSWALTTRELIKQAAYVPTWAPCDGAEATELDQHRAWRPIADELIARAAVIPVETDPIGDTGRAADALRSWLAMAPAEAGDLTERPWHDKRNRRFVFKLDAAHDAVIAAGVESTTRPALAEVVRKVFAGSSRTVWLKGAAPRAYVVAERRILRAPV